MRNYFDDVERWDEGAGALHLYVLPQDSPILDAFVGAQQRIQGIDGLPLMPEPYLHLTLQRLAQFDDDVTQRQLSDLGAALQAALLDVPSFTLTFDHPVVGERTVECTARPSADWDRLGATVRRAVAETWSSDLPAPPHAPHLTLSYATGPVDGGEVASRLGDAPALGELVVDEVHLVSVAMRPHPGIYDFTTLASWDLATPPL